MVTATTSPKKLELPDKLNLLDDLLAELSAKFNEIETDKKWKIKNTRYLRVEQDEADIVELQHQLDACGEKIAAVTSKMAAVREQEEMSANAALAQLEAARERDTKNLANLGRSVIRKRNELITSRGEFLAKLEGVVSEWFSGPIAGYVDAHTAFLEAVKELEEIENTQFGGSRFSPAVKLMLKRLQSEAGVRPEPPQRTPNDTKRLLDGVVQILNGHPCEKTTNVGLEIGLVGFLR